MTLTQKARLIKIHFAKKNQNDYEVFVFGDSLRYPVKKINYYML